MLTFTGTKLLDFVPSAKLSVRASAVASRTCSGAMYSESPDDRALCCAGSGRSRKHRERLPGCADRVLREPAILYELATGRWVFETKTQASRIAKILRIRFVRRVDAGPARRSTLGHVVQSCVARESAGRWQSAHDILLELRWIYQHGSVPNRELPLRQPDWSGLLGSQVPWAR
jgi:hypothetical protein